VAIFGRITARQRLRRATRESLAFPAFSSPVDCTPWVIGGLWPAELSTITTETATLAEHLKSDLQRIAHSANDELKMIKRAGLADVARQAEVTRVIDEARARAARRVESTVRHLHAVEAQAAAKYSHPPRAEPFGPGLDETQVIRAVVEPESPADVRGESAAQPRPEVTRSGRHRTVVGPVIGEDEPESLPVQDAGVAESAVAAGMSRIDETQVIPAVTESGRHRAAMGPALGEDEPATESDVVRLNRLLEFVVRQEPRLNWAVGDHVDGTTVLVTDLAHGWIPSGISLPAGVRLLEPEQRTGTAPALIGDMIRVVTYTPGDSLRRSAAFAVTKSSLQPRTLPAVEDLDRALSEATHWRDGLPRIVHKLAKDAAMGVGIVDQEVDVLRVHLDTARHQLLAQYPAVNSALLLNCLLLAATEAIVTGDPISANYHFVWYRKLAAPPGGSKAANMN